MPVGDCGQALKRLAKLARENASGNRTARGLVRFIDLRRDSISALEQPYLPAGDGERAERQQGSV
jgi:hypothetical protein